MRHATLAAYDQLRNSVDKTTPYHVRYCEAGEALDDALNLVATATATAIVDRELA